MSLPIAERVVHCAGNIAYVDFWQGGDGGGERDVLFLFLFCLLLKSRYRMAEVGVLQYDVCLWYSGWVHENIVGFL